MLTEAEELELLELEEEEAKALGGGGVETIANAGNTVPEVSNGPPATRIPAGTSGAETVARGLMPRSFQAAEAGAGGLRQATAGALDALSAPGRIAGSLNAPDKATRLMPMGLGGAMIPVQPDAVRGRQQADPGLHEAMADTQGKNLAQKIIRDPALLPSLATGGAAAGLASRIGLKGLGAASAAGGALGAESATLHQADKVVQGGEVNLGEAALETGLNAALPGAGALVAGGVKLGNKLLGKLAEQLSGVSEEALRHHGAGFGEGAKELAAASGKQHEIGKKLVDALDNLDDYLPEKDVVDKALEVMPPVPTGNTLRVLAEAKTGGALKSSRAVNSQIDDLIEDIAGAADETGKIPAVQFRAIRKEIDDLIGDAFGKESGRYVATLKTARHQMATDLADTAPPEFRDAMASMADKLQKADDLKAFLGKSAKTRETRAESFISTLFGKSKTERQKAVEAMGEIFGEDFLAQTKLANLAAELGEGGKAGILPRQFTGRAALGPVLAGAGYAAGGGAAAIPTLALSSPRLAGGALTVGTALERGADRLKGPATRASRILSRPFFRDEDQNP